MTTKTPPTKASRPPTPPRARTPALPKDRPAAEASAADEIILAVVVGAHGVAGEVRLKVFADDIAAYRSFNDGTLTLRSARTGSNGTIARFAEVAHRTAAEGLRGTELTVPRGELPPLGEGEYYHADLLGLPVLSSDGSAVGRVVAVENFGAGDVIEIERVDTAKRFMVPMRAEAVPHWDATRLIVDAAFVDQP